MGLGAGEVQVDFGVEVGQLDEGGDGTGEGDSSDERADETGDLVEGVDVRGPKVRGDRGGDGGEADQGVEGGDGLGKVSDGYPLAKDQSGAETDTQ